MKEARNAMLKVNRRHSLEFVLSFPTISVKKHLEKCKQIKIISRNKLRICSSKDLSSPT